MRRVRERRPLRRLCGRLRSAHPPSACIRGSLRSPPWRPGPQAPGPASRAAQRQRDAAANLRTPRRETDVRRRERYGRASRRSRELLDCLAELCICPRLPRLRLTDRPAAGRVARRLRASNEEGERRTQQVDCLERVPLGDVPIGVDRVDPRPRGCDTRCAPASSRRRGLDRRRGVASGAPPSRARAAAPSPASSRHARALELGRLAVAGSPVRRRRRSRSAGYHAASRSDAAAWISSTT